MERREMPPDRHVYCSWPGRKRYQGFNSAGEDEAANNFFQLSDHNYHIESLHLPSQLHPPPNSVECLTSCAIGNNHRRDIVNLYEDSGGDDDGGASAQETRTTAATANEIFVTQENLNHQNQIGDSDTAMYIQHPRTQIVQSVLLASDYPSKDPNSYPAVPCYSDICCCCCHVSDSQRFLLDDDFNDPLFSSFDDTAIQFDMLQCANSLQLPPPSPNTHHQQGNSSGVLRPTFCTSNQYSDQHQFSCIQESSSSSLPSICSDTSSSSLYSPALDIIERVRELELESIPIESHELTVNTHNAEQICPGSPTARESSKLMAVKLITPSSFYHNSPQTDRVIGLCTDKSSVYDFKDENTDVHIDIRARPIKSVSPCRIKKYFCNDNRGSRHDQARNSSAVERSVTKKRFASPNLDETSEHARKKKRRKTSNQLAGLAALFNKYSEQNISKEQRREFAESLNLDPEEVRIWFKYKRQKMLRLAKNRS